MFLNQKIKVENSDEASLRKSVYDIESGAKSGAGRYVGIQFGQQGPSEWYKKNFSLALNFTIKLTGERRRRKKSTVYRKRTGNPTSLGKFKLVN